MVLAMIDGGGHDSHGKISIAKIGEGKPGTAWTVPTADGRGSPSVFGFTYGARTMTKPSAVLPPKVVWTALEVVITPLLAVTPPTYMVPSGAAAMA